MDATQYADVLALSRAAYTATLRTACTLYREGYETVGSERLSTGELVWVRNTVCSINLHGASNNPFTQSTRRQTTAQVPGGRTLSFKWDEDVKPKDTVVFGTLASGAQIPLTSDKYILGDVDNDDPNRIGVQVPCSFEFVPV